MNNEKYAYKTDKKCELYFDHIPTWCGDCFACLDCGLIFEPKIDKHYICHSPKPENRSIGGAEFHIFGQDTEKTYTISARCDNGTESCNVLGKHECSKGTEKCLNSWER